MQKIARYTDEVIIAIVLTFSFKSVKNSLLSMGEVESSDALTWNGEVLPDSV